MFNFNQLKQYLSEIGPKALSIWTMGIISSVSSVAFFYHLESFLKDNIVFATCLIIALLPISTIFIALSIFKLFENKPPKALIYKYNYGWGTSPEKELLLICHKCKILCPPASGLYGLSYFGCHQCDKKHYLTRNTDGQSLDAFSVFREVNNQVKMK